MTQAAIQRDLYGINVVDNPLLTIPMMELGGTPEGITITPVGAIDYAIIWDFKDQFSGQPVQIVVNSLGLGVPQTPPYVDFITKKYTLTDVYTCNYHVDTCHYLRYRIRFEYASTDTQNIVIKYYNFVNALLRTDTIELPSTDGEMTIFTELLDTPIGPYRDDRTAKIQFTIHTDKVIDYTISNIRINQFLYEDKDVPTEPVTSYALDRMNRCFSSDVYDVTVRDQFHQATVTAIASEIDKARAIIITVLNNMSISYANGDVLDAIGAIFNMPRYTLEEDRDFLYRERLSSIWKWGYGGGCQSWITNFLQYFINWDVVLNIEDLEPEGRLLEYYPVDPKTNLQPLYQELPYCDLLVLLREEVMAGVFVAGDYASHPAQVSSEDCPGLGWVGNGEKGHDCGSLVTNVSGR